jgi:ABC-type uncharacterized transport system permease subunit
VKVGRKLVLAVIGALAMVAVLVLVLWIFRMPVGPSLERILDGALRTEPGRARTLVKMAPLLLAGLGMVVAWRAGMYNIGGEGQLILGLVCGAAVAKVGAGLPPPVLGYAVLATTALGGALYAALAGWLYIKRGVQVVISTILLNFIAVQVLAYAIRGPLQETKRELPQTQPLPDAAMMARLSPTTDLHAGIFWSLVFAVLVAVWLYRTVPGFHTRVVGSNARVARAQRIPVSRTQMRAMVLSGGLCGLAGGIDYVGIAGQVADSSAQGIGFMAIPVALLGGLDPLGATLSALYFGALFAGTENMARFQSGANSLIFVIQAVAVFAFLAFGWYSRRRAEVRGDV